MKGLLPWIGGAIIGALIIAAFVWLSGSDMPAEKHIQGWSILHDDITYRSMSGEDQIELIVTYIAEGADPRPAWPLVNEMLNNAFATIYSTGFVDCQEKCEQALDDVHAVYNMME